MMAPMVGAHRVRPKCPLDISTKLRRTQIIPILLPSTQKPEDLNLPPANSVRDSAVDAELEELRSKLKEM